MKPQQMSFFKSIWMGLLNEIIGDNFPLKSFVVEKADKGNHGRHIRGDGETLTLTRSLRRNTHFGIPGGDFGCSPCGPSDRKLVNAGNHQGLRLFEISLCESLQAGPFGEFSDADDCRVVFHLKTQ